MVKGVEPSSRCLLDGGRQDHSEPSQEVAGEEWHSD